jgi:hypothetical protein
MNISSQSLAAPLFARSGTPAARRKQALRLAFLERMEERTLLSTVDVGSGTLLYNDGGAASNVTLSLASASVEQITDSSATITLGTTAALLGWSGGGTHTVTGPTSSFAFIQVAGSSTAGANLTLNYAGGDPLPAAGLIFIPAAAAPGSTNHFTLQGGTFTSETYNGLASTVGNITYSDSGHTNTLITLINTNSVTDTTPTSSFTFNAPSPAPTVNIASGTIAGSNIYQVTDGGTGTFPFINFDNKSIATINANGGNATITMNPTAAPAGLSVLNIDSTASNNIINLQNTSSGVITDVSSANSTINIGNTFGTLAGINGDIDISDSGSTTVNINDANDTAHATATLDNASGNVVFPFEVTGLSNGTIAYGSGISALTINSGISGVSAGVTFNINNTQTGTITTFNGGANQNTYNLSSASQSNGLNNLTGAVVVHGGANLLDIVNLIDSDANFNDTYAVTDTTVTRTNFGGLTYGNIHSLTLDAENTLGTNGNNTITINGTASNVTTTILGQGGADTITVNGTGSSGSLAITTGSTPGNTINIVACSSPVSVNMNATATVNIGSTGGSGSMTGIKAAVSLLNPPDFYTLNFHDENDTTAQNWTLNDDDGNNTANIGLSSGALISYRPGDLATNTTSLNINGGSGGNTFNVNETAFNLTTTLNTGTGADTTNVLAMANNTLNINGQDDTDTLNLGNNGSAQGLAGTINVTNNGDFTAVNVNDSQDSTARTIAISDDGTTETVTGIAPAILHLLDTDVSALNLDGGTGGNTFTVNNISAGFVNTLNTGSGNDIVNVIAAPGGELNINGQGGADTVTLGSNSSLQALFGTINIGNSGGNTTLNLDNSADTTARATSIFDADGSTTIFGLSNATFSYSDTGVGTVNLSTGATADTVTVSSTGADATLNITTGTVDGTTVNIIACNAPINVTSNASTTVNVGSTGGNGTIAGIQGAVFVHNPNSFTAINLHDENDTQVHTWTLDDNSGTESIAPSGDAAVSCINAGISALTVNAGSGGNTFNVNQTSAFGTTNLNTGTGAATVNVFATGNNTLNINGQGGSNTVNLGSNGSAQGLAGTINITNNGALTAVNVNDSQDATTRTIAFSDDGTTATVTGISPAALLLHDAGIASLTLNGGSGGNTFTVNTMTTAFTNTLNTGSGNDAVNVITTTGGSLTINGQGGTDTVTLGSNSSLQSLHGAITIGNSGGNTTLNLNNSADTTAHTTSISDSLGSTHITGLTFANINYADTGVGIVNLSTGATADTVTVNSTSADATLNITTTGAVAGNTVNVIACNAPINVTSNAATTANLGSTGGNGTLSGIQGALFVHNPLNFTTLNLHDEDDATARTWTLNNNGGTDTANISMSGSSLISYVPSEIGSLTVNSGSGIDTLNVNNTSDHFLTNINTDNALGTDIVNAFATGTNTLNITGQQDFNAVNLGGLAGIGMQSLNGTINITNPNAQTTLNLDDSQDTTGRTTSVSDNGTTGTITGLCPATIHYATHNTNALNITTGSGNDSATVNSNFVDLSLNDAGGSNTLSIDSQAINPTITAGSNSRQIVVSATESNGFTALHNVNIQGYGNVNFTNLPIVITPGSAQTPTSVVHTGFTNSTVADFTVSLPLLGSNTTGLPIGDFTSGISWGDGTSDSAGAIIQDPNNPDHYFINSSHTFNAIGAFSVAASAVFTPPAGVAALSTTLNGVNINLPLTNASKTANVTAISTTPNTSVFSPGPAKTATAGKLLNKIVILLKTPQKKQDKTDNSSVTLSISGPGNFTTGSITTVNAIKGKAIFSHLQFNTAGVYVITESNGEKTISSQTFTVVASKVARLTISSPPVGPTTTTALAFTVNAFDAFGNLVSKAPVKISIASGPRHAKIVGTVSLKTTAGVALFRNLFLHTPGSYVLKVSSGSIFATTSEFDIT